MRCLTEKHVHFQNAEPLWVCSFTAIWISPVHQNLDVNTPYGVAYHGYWVNDLTKLNPRFGTPEDLKALVQAAHDRGIFVMVDVIINHMVTAPARGSIQEMLDADPLLQWRNVDEYHDPSCFIKDWQNNQQVKNWCVSSGISV